MVAWSDDFSGPDSNVLGVSPSGLRWVDRIAGPWGRRAGLAVPVGQGAHSVIDAGLNGQDGTLVGILPAVPDVGGQGLAFRDTVAGGWLLGIELYDFTYQSGTEAVVVGSQQVVVGYQQVLVRYDYVPTGSQQVYVGDEYSAFVTYRHTYAGNSSQAGQLVNFGTPGFVNPYNERRYHYAPSYSYPSLSEFPDVYISSNSVMRAYDWTPDPVKPVYRTETTYENRPVYENQPIYEWQNIWENRPVMSTRPQWRVYLSIVNGPNGTVNAFTKDLGTAKPSTIAVRLDGDSIESLVDGSRVDIRNDPYNATVTVHGIRTGLVTRGNPAFEAVTFTPGRGGGYLPVLMP